PRRLPGRAERSGHRPSLALYRGQRDDRRLVGRTGRYRQGFGIAMGYWRCIGSGRAGLIATSFAEEAEADLFNEQAVVWGAVPEVLIGGLAPLVAGGVSRDLAYLECVGELHLLAELIETRGIAGMREVISNT